MQSTVRVIASMSSISTNELVCSAAVAQPCAFDPMHRSGSNDSCFVITGAMGLRPGGGSAPVGELEDSALNPSDEELRSKQGVTTSNLCVSVFLKSWGFTNYFFARCFSKETRYFVSLWQLHFRLSQ